MKLLVIVLIALSPLSPFAQSTLQYLDEKENLLPGPEGASYYREITDKGKRYIVKDFYSANEQLAMDAICSEVQPRLVYDGPYKTYFKNGQLREDGTYLDNSKRDLWKSYYENGQQEEEVLYEKDKAQYKQHWDESGIAHLVNGSGHYVTKNVNRGDQHREILDHLLIASYSIEPINGDTTYVVVQEPATYKGGMPGLYQKIAKTLRYPADARRRGIQGKVFVEFIVEKDGNVRDVKVIKGVGGDLDEEAVRVMKTLNEWSPGKVRGKPVMQRMVLPIAFKLA